ncbi:hypothetical protein ACTNA4_11020 [Bariatricus sp. HCP28S3_A7]|uniref:hypothetical protein n=1 Tax=Bariatricus sp. HCP28S3_A7 TaxID=3438894 RepID=UPI003F88932B
MVDYREILRLDHLGYTKKDIASSVHSSRSTVSEVLTLAGNLHVCWPLDDNVTNQSLESLFYPGRNKDNEERLMPDYPKIHRELAKKGVTLTLLWTEYCLFIVSDTLYSSNATRQILYVVSYMVSINLFLYILL